MIGIITIVLIILGWFVVFWLGLIQQNKLLENNAKMKVYEELYELKKAIDEVSINLGLLFNPYSIPFLNMKYVDKSLPSSQRNLKALEFWREYLDKISKQTYAFTGAYLKLWNHIDMWIGVIPELKRAKKEFFEIHLETLTDDLNKHHSYLQNLSLENYRWEEWNQEDIKQKSQEISEKFDRIAVAYLDDLMVEIHNSLISPILGYKKKPRENFANMPRRYEILTKKGIKKVEREK
ncbi:MAG: hypothetical protein JXL97_07115 [Bacteroidales bacterium]|nr:hypothetical protein [Bacteroidales bacterium]